MTDIARSAPGSVEALNLTSINLWWGIFIGGVFTLLLWTIGDSTANHVLLRAISAWLLAASTVCLLILQFRAKKGARLT